MINLYFTILRDYGIIKIMRKTLNILFLFVLTAIVWLSYPKRSFAQGTFNCMFGISTKSCLFVEDHCETGFVRGDCSTWNTSSNNCNAPHPCIATDLARKCADKNVLHNCPAGFPVDCLPTGFTCCIDQESCNLLPKPAIYTCGYGQQGYGIDTALGCIPAGNLNEFVAWFLSKLIFIASGIAFLLMAFGAFRILTSAGSPEKIQAGKELITSALAGLIFIILSLFLLKLIGVDILQIPGFGH